MISKPLILACAAVAGLRLLAAYFLPITTDEAYYIAWAEHLSWGYFDHPPAVAWLTLPAQLWPGSAFAARILTALVSCATLVVVVKLARDIGMRQPKQLALLAAVFGCSFAAIGAGLLTTPDSLMTLAWAVALHEGYVALTRDPRRWLSAGGAVGIGLLSKYTMVLIGLVFLTALWRHQRAQLRTAWPYLGGAVALMVFLPNILWNAQNDWTTMAFQLKHGLKQSRSMAVEDSLLPTAIKAPAGSREAAVGAYFLDAREARQPKPPKPYWKKLLRRLGDFFGSQLALWGCVSLVLLFGLYQTFQHRQRHPHETKHDATGQGLLIAATATPLLFFGVIAWFSKVEANWPAIYIVSGSVLATSLLARYPRATLLAVGLNVGILFAILWHTGRPPADESRRPHRLIKETAGYPALAAHLRKMDAAHPLLVDTYQTLAMLRFYAPALAPQQLPGITRPSQFTLRPGAWTPKDSLSLLTHDRTPPQLAGYEIATATELRYCQGARLTVEEAFAKAEYRSPCFRKTIHHWYLFSYRRQAADL